MGGTTWVAAAFAANLALACGGRDTERDVRQALDRARMHKVAVDVVGKGRVVHLQGTVNSVAEREQAEEVASAVVGTGGRVLNEVTVAGLEEAAAVDSDARIERVLSAAVGKEPALESRDIRFDVKDGIVDVSGEVHSGHEKARVTRIVRATPGVKDVANGLVIDLQR